MESGEEGGEGQKYDIEIKITSTEKMGDGMSAYIVYRVVTQVLAMK